jgi:CRISPR-associated protein Cas6/Cse3/CasE subtype I-E
MNDVMSAERYSGLLRDIPMLMPRGIPENIYEVHEQLYSMFCVDGVRNFLFVIEREVAPVVLVRSRTLPAELATSAVPVEVPAAGDHRLFRLEASPTASRNGKKGRLPVGDLEARIEWLARQAVKVGFELADRPIVTWRTVSLERRGSFISRESALFEGELLVTDAKMLEHTLEHGVGRSHAFGFGLLRLFRSTKITSTK